MDFTPVELVSQSGRPWTARTQIELNNLLGKGYRRVVQPAPALHDLDDVADEFGVDLGSDDNTDWPADGGTPPA